MSTCVYFVLFLPCGSHFEINYKQPSIIKLKRWDFDIVGLFGIFSRFHFLFREFQCGEFISDKILDYI